MAKDIYIVGEDPVTKTIIRRLIKDYAPNLSIKAEMPARGSQTKSLLPKFNNVATTDPVVMLIDLDANDCPPQLKQQLIGKLKGTPKEENLLINIAVDEAEAWLFADRDGFANYLHVPVDKMPDATQHKLNGPRNVIEMNCAEKISRHLTHTIALLSTNKDIREQVGVDNPNEGCKGNEYNNVILPFIRNNWNVEDAKKNSNSLLRMIERIKKLNTKCVKAEE